MRSTFRLFSLFVLWALALSAYAQAGYVHDVTGTATVRTGNQAPRPIRVGDVINQGETIATNDKSTAVVKFEDGQVMALHERSAFTIQTYSYNKQRVAESNAAFQLLQGGLRFITGVIGATNRNSFRLTASTATIGVRGTDGVVIFNPATGEVAVAVNNGAVAMTTPLGTANIGAGTFSSSSPNLAPSTAAPVAQMAAQVAQAMNALSQAQNLPTNTPVAVPVSARAAALLKAAAENPNAPGLQQQAQVALQEALTAANAALQVALAAGATTPTPGSTGTSTTTTTTTDTSTTPTSTTTTSTPTGSGAGGGGGETTTSTTASPN